MIFKGGDKESSLVYVVGATGAAPLFQKMATSSNLDTYVPRTVRSYQCCRGQHCATTHHGSY